MIRVATPEDIDLLEGLLKELVAEIADHVMFDKDSSFKNVIQAFVNPETQDQKMALIILNDKEEPVGFVGFEAVPCLHIEVKMSRITAIYIKPAFRKKGLMEDVLTAFEYWSKKVGCKFINIAISNEEVDPSGRGYKKHEVMYIKSID